MNTAVRLEQVQKIYDRLPVVNDLSFDIEQGEVFGLLGPNGAGKSTTIRMVITLTQPTQGRIEVAGYDVIRQTHQAKKNLGVVLQQISVDGDLTVWENLEFHAKMHHIPKGDRRALINQWLEYVELTEKKQALAKTLSGGMKRRLQIARALLHNPKILLLDEPTVGLDPQTRRRIWEIIRDLNQQGMTILLTTHYMEEVEYLCRSCGHGKPGRIGIMDQGQLIKLGTLDELRSQYGEGLLMKQQGDRWDYEFFPTVQAAAHHLDTLPDKTGMMVRESNLEDIFVQLTGRQLD